MPPNKLAVRPKASSFTCSVLFLSMFTSTDACTISSGSSLSGSPRRWTSLDGDTALSGSDSISIRAHGMLTSPFTSTFSCVAAMSIFGDTLRRMSGCLISKPLPFKLKVALGVDDQSSSPFSVPFPPPNTKVPSSEAVWSLSTTFWFQSASVTGVSCISIAPFETVSSPFSDGSST